MSEAFRIFIGWDPREADCAEVLAASLHEHSSIPLSIRTLRLSELQLERPHDPLQSTEFTYTRFLVPEICKFQGSALYMDCDMLCLGDVAEIAKLPMDGLALRVRKHDHRPKRRWKMDGRIQTSYPRKNWSSLMLMRCEKLRLWTRDFVERSSGATLHRFRDIPDPEIGELPAGWNDLDEIGPDTRLTHYTSGGPWFAECQDHPHADVWLRARAELRRRRRGTLPSVGATP
jgi:hypothetical protein